MRALMLALYTLGLLPPLPGDGWASAMGYRLRMAEAVASVTDDVEEQLTLMRIARFEGDYREDVGNCTIKGAAGEVTAWQIIARGRAERATLCVSLEADAALALARVRESVRACRHLPPEKRLALYARGRCESVEGQRLSQHRYPGARVVRAARELVARHGQEGTDDGSRAAAVE